MAAIHISKILITYPPLSLILQHLLILRSHLVQVAVCCVLLLHMAADFSKHPVHFSPATEIVAPVQQNKFTTVRSSFNYNKKDAISNHTK